VKEKIPQIIKGEDTRNRLRPEIAEMLSSESSIQIAR
jgi:hypothetical protein